MAAISLRNITKSYGETAVLKGVNLDIANGEFIALVGPSGCGKSTLLRILAGLDDCDAGEVWLDEENIAQLRASKRNLAMVFQSYALYPHLTVAENMLVPLRMRQLNFWQRLPFMTGILPQARQAKQSMLKSVRQTAEMLEINHLLERKPGQLSGGQRQRVALGRAIIRQPKAFLLDEPLSNLDAKLRVQTRAEITRLHRTLATTFVYVTHDQVEAMTMADRIAVMMGGELLQCATPQDLYRQPATVAVAEFIGSPKINILPMINKNGHWYCFDRLVADEGFFHGIPYQLGIRPEHVYLTDKVNDALQAKVGNVENLGSEFLIHATMERLDSNIVIRQSGDVAPPSLGSFINLIFDHRHLHFFDKNGLRLGTQHDDFGKDVTTNKVAP